MAACTHLPTPAALIDIDEPQLMLPGNTLAKINAQLVGLGQPTFGSDNSEIPLLANTIFHSMAARYADVLSSIRMVTGKNLKRLFIVGGGSQNTVLNRLTAERTGLEVIIGSVESTTVGNLAIQLAALENHSPSSSLAGVTAPAVARWAQRLTTFCPLVSSDRVMN